MPPRGGRLHQAIRSGEDVVVACTQEERLFADLGRQTEGAISPIRFVNIRENRRLEPRCEQGRPQDRRCWLAAFARAAARAGGDL